MTPPRVSGSGSESEMSQRVRLNTPAPLTRRAAQQPVVPSVGSEGCAQKACGPCGFSPVSTDNQLTCKNLPRILFSFCRKSHKKDPRTPDYGFSSLELLLLLGDFSNFPAIFHFPLIFLNETCLIFALSPFSLFVTDVISKRPRTTVSL